MDGSVGFLPNPNDMLRQFIKGEYDEVLAKSDIFFRNSGALEVIHVTGLALMARNEQGDVEIGKEWLRAALHLMQPPAMFFEQAANAGMKRKQWKFVRQVLDEAVRLHPTNVDLRYKRAVSLMVADHLEEALEALEETLKLDPQHPPTLYSKAFLLGSAFNRFSEALNVFQGILALDNLSGLEIDRIHNNIATLFLNNGQPERGWQWLQDHCPDTTDKKTRFTKATLLLGLRHWTEAWRYYEGRTEMFREEGEWKTPTDLGIPWARNLDDLRDKNVLVLSEQGYGDTIHFVRYINLVRPLCKSVRIGLADALIRLMQVSGYSPLRSGEEFKIDDFDCAVPLIDLPIILNTQPDNVPAPIPYLGVPPVMAVELPPRENKLRVGLVWASGYIENRVECHVVRRKKSVPIDDMVELLDIDGCEFYSLHLSDHHVNRVGLRRVLEDGMDFFDTAAVVQQLDLVIAADSAVAHLAGALGKEVWLLNPLGGCWRWGWHGQDRNEWYPTMRIFRQQKLGEWGPVIDEVKQALCLKVSSTVTAGS